MVGLLLNSMSPASLPQGNDPQSWLRPWHRRRSLPGSRLSAQTRPTVPEAVPRPICEFHLHELIYGQQSIIQRFLRGAVLL